MMFHNYKYDAVTQRHSFEIHNLDISVVNAIRRTILTDIPVVGFLGEDVDVEEKPSFDIKVNTGPLHNEFLQHRLGLIPLHLDESEVEGFEADSYEFILHEKNTTNMTMDVTTEHFKILYKGEQRPEKQPRRILPAHPLTKKHILITRLRPLEELHVQGAPIKSTARIHAGFSPVSLCAFHYMVDPEKTSPSQNILDRERSYFANAYGDPLKVVFEMETETGLDYRYLLSKAVEILQERIENLLQDTDKEAHPVENGAGVEFEFPNEDDTLGHLLQAYMFTKYVREGNLTPSGQKVNYVGYYCPHPLDRKMVLKIVFDGDAEDVQMGPYLDLLHHSMREIRTTLDEVRAHWGSFVHPQSK
jgi:DNA-directed RNA polymerase subunit L